MKKILSLVMVVAMLVAVLALVGCDNTKTPDETTTEATTTEATTTEETTTEETTTALFSKGPCGEWGRAPHKPKFDCKEIYYEAHQIQAFYLYRGIGRSP